MSPATAGSGEASEGVGIWLNPREAGPAEIISNLIVIHTYLSAPYLLIYLPIIFLPPQRADYSRDQKSKI